MFRKLVLLSAVSMGIAAAVVVKAADGPADPRSEKPAAAAAAPPGPEADTFESSARRMEEKARAIYEQLARKAREAAPDGANRPTPEALYRWSLRVEWGTNWETHLQRMRQHLKEEEARVAAGRSSELEILAWQYYVTEAEMMAREMAKHRKMVQGMGNAMKDWEELKDWKPELRDAIPTTRPAP